MDSKLCLDMDDKPENMGKEIKISLCHMTGGNQFWMYRMDGKILRDYLCIGMEENRIVLTPCTDETHWKYDQEV